MDIFKCALEILVFKFSERFEVDQIIVLAPRNIGVGHQALFKFTGTVGMPLPMNLNSCRYGVAAVRKAA